MSKFKAGDKVRRVAGFDDSIFNVRLGGEYTINRLSEFNNWLHFEGINNVNANFNPKYFELIEEKKQMFDMKTNPWYININNQAEFDATQAWLKDKFGHGVLCDYRSYMKYLTNTRHDGEFFDNFVMHGESHETFRHEIKLHFVTKVSVESVEYPVVESEQAKQIRQLEETIAQAQAQVEALKKEIK